MNALSIHVLFVAVLFS